jgi:hypothetical protein
LAWPATTFRAETPASEGASVRSGRADGLPRFLPFCDRNSSQRSCIDVAGIMSHDYFLIVEFLR